MMIFPYMSLLLAKSYKDSQDCAKTTLKLCQEKGMNENIWKINLNDIDVFPCYDCSEWDNLIGRKKDFKSSFEGVFTYISRMISDGKNIRLDDNIYSIRKTVGLEFKISGKEKIIVSENRVFFNPQNMPPSETILEKVEGIVPIHKNILILNYSTWHFVKDLRLKQGKREYVPDKIEYVREI